jgi:hypothetical protein
MARVEAKFHLSAGSPRDARADRGALPRGCVVEGVGHRPYMADARFRTTILSNGEQCVSAGARSFREVLMYDRISYLFDGASAHDVAADLQQRALAELKAQNENAILSTPTDDLINNALTRYAVRIPQLREAETWVDEKEVTREVRSRGYDFYSDSYCGTRTVTAHIVNFHVPFDGDGGLFKISPSQRSIPGPAADVEHQELVITIATDQRTNEQVREEFESVVRSIKQHLSTLSRDVKAVSNQIESSARPYIEQRKAELLRSKSLVASLGFPMKRVAGAPGTYRAPDVRRKLMPARPATVAPFKPEPTLDEAEYGHILDVMDNMTKVMERSPHTFCKMGEEDIRQHFLVQLNGQYEGQATGETFNFQGKTDILIRSEGRNIFIAECKFWRGEKTFIDTIDQLLSYLSWRDSKTAVVIFNKNKNLSGVLTAIKSAMEGHPHKKSGPKIDGDTRLRYIMGNPNDHAREVVLTVMAYDIPPAS